jgi:transcriptional regulator GlxA family with amidase domain
MHHTIDFILFPDALGLDITGPLEVFNTATEILKSKNSKKNGYAIRFVAMAKGAVRLSSGLEIIASADFKDNLRCDTMVLPGGTGATDIIHNPDFMGHIKRKAANAKRIISVCNGSVILAHAGLLDGRQATTHWMTMDSFKKDYPKVRIVPDAIYTQDEHIYTSGGVTAGIDLSLALVEEDFGASVALEVSRLLLVYFRRPGSQSQFSAPLKAQEAAGKRFANLHNWLLKHINDRITVEHMADFAAMSPRNFSRVFKQTTGLTPTKYLETLRLDRAREILSAGNDSLEDISESCGFGREERLRRAFLRRFQLTPSQYYRLHFS